VILDMEIAAWSNETSLLSPWKIPVTAVLLQFTLRRMGKVAANDASSNANAIQELDQLSSKIFTHTLSSQEAYFIAQMTRGVGGAVAGKVGSSINFNRP
jgi:mediator of RNA polymerase II transcription subunit 12, fungi type